MWVERILGNGSSCRNPLWTESIAVGDEEFILSTKAKLGVKATGRKPNETDSGFKLKEPSIPYNHLFAHEKDVLSLKNSYNWDLSAVNARDTSLARQDKKTYRYNHP